MNKEKIIILLPIINFILFYVLLNNIFDISILDSVGYAITSTLLELLVFKKWLWKIKFVQNITGIKNIQGIWTGTLISNYDNKEHKIEKVIIKQSFDKYKIVLETKESKSYSEINEIVVNEFNRMELQYLYKNEAPVNLRQKNPMHFGVSNIEYKDEELIGTYWTDREIDDGKNTRGTMKLKKDNQKGNYDLISLFDLFDLF